MKIVKHLQHPPPNLHPLKHTRPFTATREENATSRIFGGRYLGIHNRQRDELRRTAGGEGVRDEGEVLGAQARGAPTPAAGRGARLFWKCPE